MTRKIVKGRKPAKTAVKTTRKVSSRQDQSVLARQLQRALEIEEGVRYMSDVRAESYNPRNRKRLQHPDATATVRGTCGDQITIDVRLRGHKISEIGFETNGCAAAIACCSRLTRMVTGRSVTAALRILPSELDESLGGLPAESKHCAVLAVNALEETLKSING